MIDQLISPSTPTDGLLEPDALQGLVNAVLAQPDLWNERVRHDKDERLFELLWLDERVEVWLICWTGEGHDTGFHDHDISQGAFGVARGELVEERLTIGNTIRRRLRAGQSVSFGTSHVHRVHGVPDGESVSIHAYSPPLRRMGVYGVSDEGALQRESVSPTHELRLTPAGAEI